jgi:hypothetical protein
MMTSGPAVFESLTKLLNELLDGPAADASFVLNPGDKGLLDSLDRLSASEASTIPAAGGASVAAHVDHLTYGLGLLNRWKNGEQPFADADYSASWKRTNVSDAEWAVRRHNLRNAANAWRDAVPGLHDLNDVELNGVVASVVHLAYHLGAIRQINRSLRGPAATD